MPNKAESRFRRWSEKIFIDAFIHKIADHKQTGNAGNSGLTDYLIIFNGRVMFFEVKKTDSKNTFNLNLIYETQWIRLNKMVNAKAEVYIAIYMDDNLYIIPFLYLKKAKFDNKLVSVKKDALQAWSIQWKT